MDSNFQDYKFQNKKLLQTALTHRSFGEDNYERLEFLGDSVLGFVITEFLYQKYSDEDEGVLTRLRATLVRKESLAQLARVINLGERIKLGPGERKSGGWRRDSILANTMEAVIGAIYLDSDISQCKKFILSIYQEMLDAIDIDGFEKDPKTILQELLQAKRMSLPVYKVLEEFGEPHQPIFRVSCEVVELGEKLFGEGKSKRLAEQSAASKTLKFIENKV